MRALQPFRHLRDRCWECLVGHHLVVEEGCHRSESVAGGTVRSEGSWRIEFA